MGEREMQNESAVDEGDAATTNTPHPALLCMEHPCR